MSDTPPSGFDDGHSNAEPPTSERPPDAEGERRAIGRQLHTKILALQNHEVYRKYPNPITTDGLEIVRGVRPVSAWGIELNRPQSLFPIFHVDGLQLTDQAQAMYKLPADDDKPERMGLAINGIVNGEDKHFFIEVDSDGNMDGLMQVASSKPYVLAEVDVDVTAMPAFIRDTVEDNSANHAQQMLERRKGDPRYSEPRKPEPRNPAQRSIRRFLRRPGSK